MERAAKLWEELSAGRKDISFGSADEGLPDVLHALSQIMKTREGSSLNCFRAIRAAYVAAKRATWPVDVLAERQTLLAAFAFHAWEHSRRHRSYAEMKSWERRCVVHTSSIESVGDFLALPTPMRSAQLRRRFFADPGVLLAACAGLSRKINSAPAEVAKEACALYAWVVASNDQSDSFERLSFFAGELSLLVASSHRLLGMFADAVEWIGHAERHFGTTAQPEPMLARTGLVRATLLYDQRAYSAALDCVPALVARFRAFGMDRELILIRFVEALVFKNQNRKTEALQQIKRLLGEPVVRRDVLLLSLVGLNLGELEAELGDVESARRRFEHALPLVARTGTPIVLGSLQGVLGQVLRDQGRFYEAVEAYRRSISAYASGSFLYQAAYMRIVAAEVLVMSGRYTEALAEVITALPLIEKEGVLPDFKVAVSLLRESLRRQNVDPVALRDLRGHLERLHNAGRS